MIEVSAQDILYSGKFTFILSTQLIKPNHCLYVYCLLYIFLMLLFCKSFNLHLTLYTLANISMHLLHTVLYTFLKGLKRRSCLTVKSSLVVDHFPYSHDLNV